MTFIYKALKITIFILVIFSLNVPLVILNHRASQKAERLALAFKILSNSLTNCQEETRLSLETTRLSQDFVGVLYRHMAFDALMRTIKKEVKRESRPTD